MSSISHYKKLAERARATAKNMREKAEGTLQQAVTSVEVVGAGFLASYARGRMGDENGQWLIGGVDFDLAAGLGMHALGFLGAFGRYDEHAHALGNGALACYAVHKGFALGDEAKHKTSSAGSRPNALNERRASVFETDSALEGAFARS
jgi:hypothetical protein